VEFVQALVKQAAQELPMEIKQIRFVPWKRAMSMSEHDKNCLMFSVSRTPEREERFYWIGQISPYKVTLYRHKDGPEVSPETLDELANYRFGTQAGGAFEELLARKGITDIASVTYARRAIKMAQLGRVDFTPLVHSSFYYRMEQYGLDPNDFVPTLDIDELSKELWLIAGKKTEPEVIAALKRAYQRLEQQGLLNQLVKAYHPESAIMRKYRQQKQQGRRQD
jgi:polar amino acid transport system substrate-binding protein